MINDWISTEEQTHTHTHTMEEKDEWTYEKAKSHFHVSCTSLSSFGIYLSLTLYIVHFFWGMAKEELSNLTAQRLRLFSFIHLF